MAFASISNSTQGLSFERTEILPMHMTRRISRALQSLSLLALVGLTPQLSHAGLVTFDYDFEEVVKYEFQLSIGAVNDLNGSISADPLVDGSSTMLFFDYFEFDPADVPENILCDFSDPLEACIGLVSDLEFFGITTTGEGDLIRFDDLPDGDINVDLYLALLDDLTAVSLFASLVLSEFSGSCEPDTGCFTLGLDALLLDGPWFESNPELEGLELEISGVGALSSDGLNFEGTLVLKTLSNIVVSVPEPGTLGLFTLGLISLLRRRHYAAHSASPQPAGS